MILFSTAAVEMPILVKMTQSRCLKGVFEEPLPQRKTDPINLSPQIYTVGMDLDIFNLKNRKKQ